MNIALIRGSNFIRLRRVALGPSSFRMVSTLFLLIFLSVTLPAEAGENPWTLLPGRPQFSPLLADPREPSIGMVSYTSEKGFEGSLGGTLEFLRWKSAADMEWGWGIFTGIWTLSDSPVLTDLGVV